MRPKFGIGHRAGLFTIGLLASALTFTACSDDPESKKPVAYEPGECDPIVEKYCALPWPSSLYLVENADNPTGHELSIGDTSLPRGRSQMRPDAWNGLDGYGPSTPILFHVPNLDLNGLPSEENMRASWEGDIGQAGLFKMEDDGSLSRVPFWMETDLRDTAANAITFMRPAIVLEENTRYVVALRNLKHTDGSDVEATEAFQKLVNDEGYYDPELSGRQDRFNEIFDALETVGMNRDELVLAWDFNTMSDEHLHGPMLRMRELALDYLADAGPEMTITRVVEYQNEDPDAPNYHAVTAFEFEGTFQTPHFMKEDGPGWVFNLDENGQVAQNGTVERDFWIFVPWSAVGENAAPAGLMQYGHGLLGYGSQVRGNFNRRVAQEYNYIHFASNWTGMSTDDVPAVASVLSNFSNFRRLSDNMHQGIIEFMVLAKGMMHTFPALDEVTENDIQVDTEKIFYNGISQGGIYGATYVAISPDIDVGHLGVPGINYSMLLDRSVDFDGYAEIARLAYSSTSSLTIAIAAAQTLWDMTDPSTYYRHLEEDPFPGNNKKYVLLAPAKGDFQVSPLTNLIAANSDFGVAVMPGWNQDYTHMGIQETPYETDGQPYKGSGIVLYDLGNAWPPPGNITPVYYSEDGKDANGLGDPHGIPRFFPAHQEQMIHFLESGGEIINVCIDEGCIFQERACGDTPNIDRRECWVNEVSTP